ncbi:MAG: hypothetical protein ACI4MI_00170 [Christensenellales bacterium]
MNKKYYAKPMRIRKSLSLLNSYVYLSGVKACYKYDGRVKKIFDEMPDGFDLVIGVLDKHHAALITKVGGELQCKIVIDYISSNNSLQIMFKNIASEEIVLANQISFFQAYTQGRLITIGDNLLAVKYIKMMMIVQSYLASIRQRKESLPESLPLEVAPAIVKSRVMFRGLL